MFSVRWLVLTLFDLVALVNRDQLDILASLRESVNDDKIALEEEVARLQQQLKEAAEKNKMQLEQINGLLLEKVNLQSEGIGQREKMLQRERDFGCVSTFPVKQLADRLTYDRLVICVRRCQDRACRRT